MRSLGAMLAAPVGLLLLVGCSESAATEPAGPQVSRDVTVRATFSTTAEPAITYADDLVRVGARVAVSAESAGGSTTVRLAVRGLQPGRTYGAHAHNLPCGPDGEAAGAHFQHRPDPQQPSTDPAYANPDNEVWLDLTTDAAGAATTEVTLPWQFTDRRPRSVVIHAEPTRTGAGEAGTAGQRAACITVDF